MNIKRNSTGRHAGGLFRNLPHISVAWSPDDGAGSGGADEGGSGDSQDAPKDEGDGGNTDPNPSQDEAKGKAKDENKRDSKLSDKEAELLREVMERKAKLKAAEEALAAANTKLKEFEGIDPNEVRKLIAEKREAERKAAEAAGDFERVKAMMAEEHAKEVEKIKAEAAEIKSALEAAQQRIADLTIGSAFSNSSFVAEDLVLTPAKARVVYGSHCEVEDDEVVVYDKPRGAKDRTKLVDGQGRPLRFDDAIRKLVDADPDRDSIVRSKLKEGAKSGTQPGKPSTDEPKLFGRARLEAILAKRAK